MSYFEDLSKSISLRPQKWLVTGCAGFIGSHLVQYLLNAKQIVVGLDNFATGKQQNLDQVCELVGAENWQRFTFINGDICNFEVCQRACQDITIVLHEAALGSVPRSVDDPLTTHKINVDGFVNMLLAARDANVKRFVYASSSSVYGDSPELPKVEDKIGKALSPYAASKLINEVYADVFGMCYSMQIIGLRYFNVFGPRQDPNGAYAAVIPRWIDNLLQGNTCEIYGDGETSRDFCYVDNVVLANILASITDSGKAIGRVYNVGLGGRTTLKQLYQTLQDAILHLKPDFVPVAVRHLDFRSGDVRHSLADITRISEVLGFVTVVGLAEGLLRTIQAFEKSR